MKEDSAVQIRWTPKAIGILSVLIAMLSSLGTLALAKRKADIEDTQITQKQNDRLDNLETRVTRLEKIAEDISPRMARIEERLDGFGKQHEVMMGDLKGIREILIQQHDRERLRRNSERAGADFREMTVSH